MPSSIPSPVAAAVGLVPAALDGVRSLPARAVSLPIRVVTHSLTTVAHAKQGYDDLAERGERLIARLRGDASGLAGQVADRADALEDRVEEVVERTPLGRAYDKAEDALEDAGDSLRAVAGKATRATRSAAGQAADTASDAADALKDTASDAVDAAKDTAAGAADAVQDAVPEAERPKGVPTPKATEPDTTRVDTAVTPEVEQVVEQTAAEVAVEVPDHDDLPLPDYDHMTLGSLRGRLRSLDVAQLITIRAYEKAHADRLPVVTMLDNRIAKLSTDTGATPSGTPSTAPAPEQQAAGAEAPGKVTEETANPPAGTPVGAKPTLSQG